MGGTLKILLSLQSHFVDIGLVKFKLFSTVPLVVCGLDVGLR